MKALFGSGYDSFSVKRRHFHPARCKQCGAFSGDVGPISQTGFCGDCGRAALVSNIDQMHARSGPNFALWRRQMAASVGAVLLDDLEAIVETERQ